MTNEQFDRLQIRTLLASFVVGVLLITGALIDWHYPPSGQREMVIEKNNFGVDCVPGKSNRCKG